MTGQKFFRGDRVRVGTLPRNMPAHVGNVDAIVDHSYGDYISFKRSDTEYALRVLDERDGSWRFVAWYPEAFLTLISDDRAAGEKILQEAKH